ncbi:hypothetical protein G7076_08200 [Sphingomonas sp. HDW15A]|uniref:M56 family metallopeptidase n=1 Tax=Sphingomonas sp. HDW15A TaxID=2714942 RepID=UPI00140E1F5A|nr:M56 family metallopeptidase [Sphingomonas sp. HDW15A]QIK96424.1 hypothetical protein G7076_08200 [Sphingomonas sp. HDW15A]
MSALAVNLLGASLLVAIVLLIRRPVARTFGARAAYALWLAPAIRLMFPPLPDFVPTTAEARGSVDWSIIVEPVARAAASRPSIDWTLVWGAGALTFLGLHLLRHWWFLHRALRDGRPYEVDGIDCDMVITPAVDGPAATGLIHRLILLPADFEARFTPDQQRVALLHECLHHRRGDLWASAAALFGAAALWFNPLAYIALGAFRRDMESACDSTVLETPGACDPQFYGETILRSAARPIPRSLCALTSIDELKGRLIMLNATHGSFRRFAGLGVAAFLVVGGLALPNPAIAQDKKEETVIEKKIIMHGDGKHEMSADHEGMHEMKCPGEMTTIESSAGTSGDKKEQRKIAICSKSGDKAEIAAGLEKALARIEKDSDIDATAKADISAKLRAKIAELRGQ